MRRRPFGLAALLVTATTLLAVLLPGVAKAATDTYLRLAHLSPDTPAVDVTVTSAAGQVYRLNGGSYGNVSSYLTVDPGNYTVQMRPAGAPAAPPILTGTVRADRGRAYTAAVLGPQAGAGITLFTDDLAYPGPGNARVRIVQGAQAAGSVSITWNGTAMAGPASFGTATGYVNASAGHGTFSMTPTNGAPPFLLPVNLAEGGVYTVIVLQRGGTLNGQVQNDALYRAGGSNGGGVGIGSGSGSGAGNSGNGSNGQFPVNPPTVPDPYDFFHKFTGATDWKSVRSSLDDACNEDAVTDKAACLAAAADYFAKVLHSITPDDVLVSSGPPDPNADLHCHANWTDDKKLVVYADSEDAKAGCLEKFSDVDRQQILAVDEAKYPRAALVLDTDAATPTPTNSAGPTTEPPVPTTPSTEPPPVTEPPPNPGPPSTTEAPPNPGPPPEPGPPPNPGPPPDPGPPPITEPPPPAPGPDGTGGGQPNDGNNPGGDRDNARPAT